ncbi:hypothetical protein ACFLXU_02655 [Chloroflexota bacterium]
MGAGQRQLVRKQGGKKMEPMADDERDDSIAKKDNDTDEYREEIKKMTLK